MPISKLLLCPVLGKAKRRHLNAVDCEELRQNAEGVGALTQPHTVKHRQSSYNPNHGLYPRTSYKRRKCGKYIGCKYIDFVYYSESSSLTFFSLDLCRKQFPRQTDVHYELLPYEKQPF